MIDCNSTCQSQPNAPNISLTGANLINGNPDDGNGNFINANIGTVLTKGGNGYGMWQPSGPLSYPTDGNDILVWKCDDINETKTLGNTGSYGSPAGDLLIAYNPTVIEQGSVGLFSDCVSFILYSSNDRPTGATGANPGSGPFTISAWVYIPEGSLVSTPPSTDGYILSKWFYLDDDRVVESSALQLNVDWGGQIQVVLNNTVVLSTDRYSGGKGIINEFRFNDWNFIAFGTDGTNWLMSVNGHSPFTGSAFVSFDWGNQPWTLNGSEYSEHYLKSLYGMMMQDVRVANVCRISDTTWVKNVIKYGLNRKY